MNVLTISYYPIEIKKLYPLAISRGVSFGSKNLIVEVTDGEFTGIGEAAPGAGFDETLADLVSSQLTTLFPSGQLPDLTIEEMWDYTRSHDLAPPGIAAIDTALWDLQAKKEGKPLYRLLGLTNDIQPTSITIGLNPPEVTSVRVPEMLERTHCKSLKIKLGSPQGVEFDKVHFESAQAAAAPFKVKLRVDANGGWSVETAKMMIDWLAERRVDYVEQPLKEGNEDGLAELHRYSSLPIFIDESCRFAADVPKWADHIDGVNLKLMKCGGITEARRIVSAARDRGLQTMIGCMGETSISIAAGVAIGALFDHIDLDSQLNLDPDPAEGLNFSEGVVSAPDTLGHGAYLRL